MLYVVGPRGQGCEESKSPRYNTTRESRELEVPLEDKASFIKSIEELSETAMNTIHEYNTKVVPTRPELPSVNEVRWCLVSGGVYKHKDVSKLDVAEATIKGMMLAKANISVTMMYDDDVFKQAYKRIKVKSLRRGISRTRLTESKAVTALDSHDVETKDFALTASPTRPPLYYEEHPANNTGILCSRRK